MSKMLDAVIAAKLKNQKFRDSIRDLILADRSLLMNVRLSYGNLRLNNEPWNTPKDDQVALDEYLAKESSSSLLDIYAELNTNFIIKKPTYFETFKAALQRSLYQIVMFVQNLKKGLKDSKYGDLFVEIAKKDRGFYRKLLQKPYSDEQKFNEFLRYIKVIIGNNQIKEAHNLLQSAEKKLLGGLVASSEMESKVEDRIQQNLRLAYAIVDNLPSATGFIPDPVDQKIKSAASLVNQLIVKMRSQTNKIKNPLINKKEKRQIFVILQQYKIKLMQFIVKTDALSRGKTLLNQTLDLEYMRKQLSKFPSSHDANKILCNPKSTDQNKIMLRLFDIAPDTVNVKISPIVFKQQEQAKYQVNKVMP